MAENLEVLEKLLRRAEGKKDNYKIGLMIQGGGMRGSFAGGVMIELEKRGLAHMFDVIYSSSSGSLCAAYLLSEKTEEGTSIFWENLSGRKFIQPWRFWKLMNLDYLIDDVVKGQKPINQEKIFNPKTLFKIYLAEPKSGVTLAVTNLEKDIIFQALKATCAFPGCYYPLVRINGKKYLDGNSVKVFPLEQAKNDGCTDLLIVTTVDKDHTEPVSKSLRNRILFTTFMFPLGRKFKERFNKRTLEYNKELDYVFGRKGIEGINIYTISPEYMLSNSCTNYEKLKEFAKHGRERAKESFQRVEDRVLR